MLRHIMIGSLLLPLVAAQAAAAARKHGEVLRVDDYSITAMPYLAPLSFGPSTYQVDDDTRIFIAFVTDHYDPKDGKLLRKIHVKRGTLDDVRSGRRVMINAYRGRAMQITIMPVEPRRESLLRYGPAYGY